MSTKEILEYKKDPNEDYYSILNCSENSSNEQILAEYKVLALQYHPDKNDGNKDSESKFQLMKEAKDVLTDPERRKNYDKWRSSGIAISYKNWVGMKEHVQQSMHWSNPKTKDRMLAETTGGSSSSLNPGAPNSALRRASEGGAALYYGGRKGEWGSDNPNEVVSKFRNYEI